MNNRMGKGVYGKYICMALKKKTKFKMTIYPFSPSPLLALIAAATLPLSASCLEPSQCVTLQIAYLQGRQLPSSWLTMARKYLLAGWGLREKKEVTHMQAGHWRPWGVISVYFKRGLNRLQGISSWYHNVKIC